MQCGQIRYCCLFILLTVTINVRAQEIGNGNIINETMLPEMEFRFFVGDDIVSRIEDSPPEYYNAEKLFLDSIRKWKAMYPDFELKNNLRIYPKKSEGLKDLFIKIDSAFVDIMLRDSVIIENYKFRSLGFPDELIKVIIKYPPEELTATFRNVYATFNFSFSKKYADVVSTFDFRKRLAEK